MLYIELVLIGISLSMDAFSLALSISASQFNKIRYIKYAIFVGIFHFFMPILGHIFKESIDHLYVIPSNIIFNIVIIFIIFGIIIDNKKEITSKILNPFIFAFTVSIDSFSVGLSLSDSNIYISGIIFSIISFLFTYLGFNLGELIQKNLEKYSKIFAILILLVVLIIKLI